MERVLYWGTWIPVQTYIHDLSIPRADIMHDFYVDHIKSTYHVRDSFYCYCYNAFSLWLRIFPALFLLLPSCEALLIDSWPFCPHKGSSLSPPPPPPKCKKYWFAHYLGTLSSFLGMCTEVRNLTWKWHSLTTFLHMCGLMWLSSNNKVCLSVFNKSVMRS